VGPRRQPRSSPSAALRSPRSGLRRFRRGSRPLAFPPRPASRSLISRPRWCLSSLHLAIGLHDPRFARPAQQTPQSGRCHRNRTSGGHGTEPGPWGDKYGPTSPLSSHPFSATHKHRGAAAGNHRCRTSVGATTVRASVGGGKHTNRTRVI
jgi:hypothetical protein